MPTDRDTVHHGQQQHLRSVIIEIWKKEISSDYSRHFLLKEDTLKNAIYYHLRRKLGEDYMFQHRLRIFTEFTVGDQRIDLVVAQVDVNQATTEHLQNCVERIIVALELKYKASPIDTEFKNDVSKTIRFLQSPELQGCHFFLGFIQEVPFRKPVDFTWLNSEQRVKATGLVTELIQFLDEDTGVPVWDVVAH